MTNTQYYISIGIPMFTILVVWIGSVVTNRASMKAVNLRIDDVNLRIADVNLRIGDVNLRIDDLRADMNRRFEDMNRRFDRLEGLLERIDREIRVDHERRLTILEERLLAKAG